MTAHTTATSACDVATPAPAEARRNFTENVRTWLPALIVLLGMPVLALVTTKYILLPPIQSAMSSAASAALQNTSSGMTPYIARFQLNHAPKKHSGIQGFAIVGDSNSILTLASRNKTRFTEVGLRNLGGMTTADLWKPGVLDAICAQIRNDLNREVGVPVVKQVVIQAWPES